MWLFLWALFSLQPARAESPLFLWEQGTQFFDQKDLPQAVFFLDKLTRRYPGQPTPAKSLEAHWKLGQAYFSQGLYQEALSPLRYFTEARSDPSHSTERQKALLLLSRCYLKLQRFQEAHLSAQSVRLVPLQPEASLLQAQALLLRGHLKPAQDLLDQALRSDLPPALKAEAVSISVQMKAEACKVLPSKGPLLEAQFQDQLSRRGDCLLEMVNLAQSAPREAGDLEERIKNSFQDYLKACSSPPPPADRKKRSQLELKRYLSELANQSLMECQAKLKAGIDASTSPALKKRLNELSPSSSIPEKNPAHVPQN